MRGNLRTILTAMTAWLGLTMAAFAAGFGPNDFLHKPSTDLALASPYYTTTLPSYIGPGTLKASLSYPLESVSLPELAGPEGSLNSWVYENPQTSKLTFVYQLLTQPSMGSSVVDGMTLGNDIDGGANWLGVGIQGVGANGSGQSTAYNGESPSWTNGDPEHIYRQNLSDESIGMLWHDTVPTDGTHLNGATNDKSSLIWFETDATAWGEGPAGIISHSGANSAALYVGPAAVPEPGSIVLFGVAGLILGVLWGLRRR